MQIKDQAIALRDVFDKWAAGKGGGSAKIASDKSQLTNILAFKPGALRVVVLYIGEIPRGDETAAQMSRVDREFWIIFSRGMGFKLDPADSLTKGSGGGQPMYELVEEGRDLARTIQFDPQTTERPVYFRGVQPFDAGENMRVDAYVVSIAIGTDIGYISDEPQPE